MPFRDLSFIPAPSVAAVVAVRYAAAGASDWPGWPALADHVASGWRHPDGGIASSPAPCRHWTVSKVLAWHVLDRAVHLAPRWPAAAHPVAWEQARDAVHRDVCWQAWSERRGAFTTAYGSDGLDPSVLLIPLVGFLPADDVRVRGTIDAVLPRFWRDTGPARWWLVSALVESGRTDRAREVFDRLTAAAPLPATPADELARAEAEARLAVAGAHRGAGREVPARVSAG